MGARMLANSKSSTHLPVAHAFEAEGVAAEVAEGEPAGVAVEGRPRVASASEKAATTPSTTAVLRLLGAFETGRSMAGATYAALAMVSNASADNALDLPAWNIGWVRRRARSGP